MTEKYEFIVIGAGIYGAATAWHLACKGASVKVLEADDIGTRASGGPGRRGVRANGRDVRELALMKRAYAIWPTLHEILGVPPFYEQCGHLLLAESDIQVCELEARAWLQRGQGIETELLNRDELRTREPGLSHKIEAALYCPQDGVANHSVTTRAYAAAAIRAGVSFSTSTSAKYIEFNNSRADAVITADGKRYEAKRGILIVANAGVQSLLGEIQYLPTWNECLQVLISAPLGSVPFSHLTGHIGRTVSLKREGNGRVMISGGWHGSWDPETNQGYTINAAVEGNVTEAIAIYPLLKDLKIEVSDANHLETFTPDKIPIIDQLRAHNNVWYATGWCGHGWAIAPVIAEDLAKWMMDGERPQHLEPFRISRFTK